uniref:Uncharacterized protein n=1 Tax=Palpitomonas bilix TaxID=652834 RepID=A0A7S3GK71_9EUKA|mmetsp:Transcript_6989/g.17898  ORF Transcript_6989/g.17898 Transcript_6989/m.17898 type:complete len:298 (+) Transcript_6989:106-999(+)|eukprot:CAMPEP_0113875826 /NCGR_PEP_ID=MMETSP0780_2-20120614/5151_1 /TAXON_ID=652834 /ORGANISM="Palpitomonas bilix" /LENGTH=297 /DNA_ID=CAMNT_0000861845 /DNA_START=127 /DNA_END=1020 /DNA_ORIENTATION=+ /assembly_acc=CAM_ASM_000599
MSASKEKKGKEPWKHILAGGGAGAIEATAMYPMEFGKVQLQLQSKALKPRYSGLFNVLSTTMKERGAFAIYRGLGSLIAGCVPKAAVRFGTFEFLKRKLSDEDGSISKGKTFVAGLGAGVFEAAFAVCPAEMVKTRLIHDQAQAVPKYRGFFHATAVIVREEGIGALYKGIGPTLLKQASNQGIRFVSYASIVENVKKVDFLSDTVATFVSGSCAGVTSLAFNHPIDTVKSRMQGLEAHRYSSSWQCFTSILKNEGFAALYQGVIPRTARVVPGSGIIFMSYAELSKLLDKMFPSSH